MNVIFRLIELKQSFATPIQTTLDHFAKATPVARGSAWARRDFQHPSSQGETAKSWDIISSAGHWARSGINCLEAASYVSGCYLPSERCTIVTMQILAVSGINIYMQADITQST